MNFKEVKSKIKEEQKELAKRITRGKFLRKAKNRADITDDEKKYFIYKFSDEEHFMNWKVEQLSNDYRHRHIVYCNMFNNTPYDKIEKPREKNSPDGVKLSKIRKSWESMIDEEALRDCA
jgi:hypothetical protein